MAQWPYGASRPSERTSPSDGAPPVPRASTSLRMRLVAAASAAAVGASIVADTTTVPLQPVAVIREG
eukprot:7380700-Prymnesium_polylepis.1